MDYVPDWSERSWQSAPYRYGAPDAPDYETDYENEWDAHADDYDDLGEC